MNGISYRYLYVYAPFLNTKTTFDYCNIIILCDFKYSNFSYRKCKRKVHDVAKLMAEPLLRYNQLIKCTCPY